MCWPSPSAISDTPIISRKLSASIFTVGWRCTKSLSGAAANIITPTASTTAAIITGRWRDIPTAVITESSENTMSSRTICPTTAPNEARARVPARSASPSSPSWISRVLFAIRKRPPATRIRSRPENGWPSTWNSGAVRRMIHASAASSAMRVTIAPARPTRRARPCCCCGSLPARIEMKMMLSMPRTISSTVNVSRPSHASGLDIKLMVGSCRNVQCSMFNDHWTFVTLERNGKANLGPAESDARLHLCRPSCGAAEARGDQRIHRAQHVIGEEQADLVLRAPKCVVAALDVIAKHLVLERMVAPAPLEVGTHSARLIKLQRFPVLRGGRIGTNVGILPVGPPRQEPHRSIVGLGIALGHECRSGIGVVGAAFGEPLHLLVVLEDGVAPDRPERA